MEITKNSYSISKIKKLIDLNHDMINFKVIFNVISNSDQPFWALVVDQSTIDTLEDSQLEYKQVVGTLSGEIVADKNIYQNYYIILKSEKQMSVDVELQTTKLPDYIEPSTASQDLQQDTENAPTDYGNIMIYLLAAIIVVGIVYIIINKTNKESEPISTVNTNQSLLAKMKKIQLE
jgi:hypothetical protein